MVALVDANVWLPLLLGDHVHHDPAWAWWSGQAAGACCWCRPIQQTVLRLLTNRTVMGEAVLNPEAAWLVWEKLVLDERCAFLPLEPEGLDALWEQNISGPAATPKLWMDAYLAAWAEAARLGFVTFDAGFSAFTLRNLQLLVPVGR